MTAVVPAVPVPRLLVWRHGRTRWNAEGRFQGQLDPPLDDVGRDQAARTAPYLLAAGLPPETVVVSSDLTRAAETGATLSALLGVPLRLDARLREVFLGSWQGLTRDEVAERYPEQYADWLAGRPVRGRGAEEPAQVAGRALAALADLPQAPVAVVVTHGGTGLRLLETLLGLVDVHRRIFGPLGNCAWSEISQAGGRWRLLRHNQSVPSLPEGASGSAAIRGAVLRPVPDQEATPGIATSGIATSGIAERPRADDTAPAATGDADAVG